VGKDALKPTQNGNTLLIHGVGTTDFEVVKWLVEEGGVDVNSIKSFTYNCINALWNSMRPGMLPVVMYLIEKGAKISQIGLPNSLLTRAVHHSDLQVVKYLLGIVRISICISSPHFLGWSRCE